MSQIDEVLANTLQVDGYTIYYDAQVSAEQTIEEIFHQRAYQFKTTLSAPFIIDAGSNIGIATLFFKKYYSNAKIICFEPDPVSFSILQKNVAINQLKKVTLVNAALSDVEGKVKFYGQVNVDHPDTRGNSLLPLWGLQRDTSCWIEVDAIRLSQYIHAPVDLLKLDIEGAEQKVLEELDDKLLLVKEIALEFHEAEAIKFQNNLEATVALLRAKNFSVTILEKPNTCFPESIKMWAEKTQPTLYYLKAIRDL